MGSFEEFKVLASSKLDEGLLEDFSSKGPSQHDFIHNGVWRTFEDEEHCRTFFLLDQTENEIAGYFTLSPYAVNKEVLPGKARRNLWPLGYYGGFLIGQLSTNSSYSKLSTLQYSETMGQILLQFIFKTVALFRDRLGGRFIYAESEYEDLDWWYENNGFVEGRKKSNQKLFFYDPVAAAD